MIQEFAQTLRKQLNDDIEHLRDSAGDGECRSFEDYKHLTGRIQGLLQARKFLNDLAKKAQQHDE